MVFKINVKYFVNDAFYKILYTCLLSLYYSQLKTFLEKIVRHSLITLFKFMKVESNHLLNYLIAKTGRQKK